MTGIGGSPESAVWMGLFVLCAVGTSVFDRFECETPAWKKVLRWTMAAVLSQAAASVWGYWALGVLAVLAVTGLTVHLTWCRRHGIHPLRATPRRRYYELRKWAWEE